MGYRQKSPEQVLSEMTQLAAATGVRRFGMTDNIMPVTYYNTLMPALAKAGLGLDIFYEQKANISLDKVLALKAAGVNGIQPGIESLQDDLLRLMKKGTSTKQNIALLRYARSVGMTAKWNILSGFPGGREEWYEDMLRLVPLLVHLEPPSGVARLNVDRFSPYFDRPTEYGITNVRPLPSYQEVFPRSEDLDRLSYHFTGDSDGCTVDNSETVRQLRATVEQWQRLWDFTNEETARPCLEVVEIDPENYLLIDSRPLPDVLFMQQISADQASVALSFHNEESALTRWGEERYVCIKGQNGFIPLACATPEVLKRFEKVRAPDLQDAAV
jgi:ribosomal peptide maturation radical SAM protein 1